MILSIHHAVFTFVLSVLLILLPGAPTVLHAQSSPSISITLSPGHNVPQNTEITATITLSNLDVGSYSSVILRADLTVYGHGERRCNGDDTGKDIEVPVDEGREILRDVRIYDACSFYTYGNYVLDVRIFKADELALDGRIGLASATTQFSMSRYLNPGESILPPPASGIKAWLDPDPRTLGMRVGEWHRFKLRSDILLYLNDHSGIHMYGSQPDFFVAPGETTPSNTVEEACQGPYFLDLPWRRATHQSLWIGACKAGDGVIEVRHETAGVAPLYKYEFRTLARVYNSEPTLTIANVRAAEGDGEHGFHGSAEPCDQRRGDGRLRDTGRHGYRRHGLHAYGGHTDLPCE